MCGIAGSWDASAQASREELERLALRMAEELRHRGPDDAGAWADPQAGLALGHRRLAILDLSQEGHQPMLSPDGRYVLVFNGEIYNFDRLRRELEEGGQVFRGHSDTEVLLAAIGAWGLSGALRRCTGMFALALWDRRNRTLHLARDRAGEKPLYYGWADGVFIFASELKAFRAHPRWQGEIARDALASLVRYGYIPAPQSIYTNVFKLPPASLLSLSEAQIHQRETGGPKCYWSLPLPTTAESDQPSRQFEAEATEQLLGLLRRAVAQQMVADVPLGAFLSGGIDSSLVVALMQAQSVRPVRTFTIGFTDQDRDEAPAARAVARHLGTEHTELYVSEKELLPVVSRLPEVYDEPFADPSQIPTLLLCQLARSRVTVSLSGDAGDELFAGYAHHRKGQRLWKLLRPIPAQVRAPLAGALQRFAQSGFSWRLDSPALKNLLERVWNLSEVLPARTDHGLYQLLISSNRQPLAWLREAREPATPLGADSQWAEVPEFLHRMMRRDFMAYLPDDILVKVDRAAMAVSLETRIPLLDHRVIEFAWRLPSALKQRAGQGKWLLRQILHQFVPAALVERPKKGFGVPLSAWLRGPLRDWAEDLLEENRLNQEGFLNTATVRGRWQEHLARKRDWELELWHVLAFQAWLRGTRSARAASGGASLRLANLPLASVRNSSLPTSVPTLEQLECNQ